MGNGRRGRGIGEPAAGGREVAGRRLLQLEKPRSAELILLPSAGNHGRAHSWRWHREPWLQPKLSSTARPHLSVRSVPSAAATEHQEEAEPRAPGTAEGSVRGLLWETCSPAQGDSLVLFVFVKEERTCVP